MRTAQKLVVGVTALVGLGVGSLGLGFAHASPAPPTPVSSVTAEVGGSSEPLGTPSSVESDGPGGHQDVPGANVESGTQSGPDTSGAEVGAAELGGGN